MSESRFHGRLFENLDVLLNKTWYLNYVKTMFENLEVDKYYENSIMSKVVKLWAYKTSAQIDMHNMVSSRLWSKLQLLLYMMKKT